MSKAPLGILGAMEDEVNALLGALENRTATRIGNRDFHRGTLFGRDCVIAFSRWGKVAAATSATHLISRFGVDEILFTGIGGGVDPAVRIGDLVVGTRLFQHDMNPSPIFPRHEIPLLGISAIPACAERARKLEAAARRYVTQDMGAEMTSKLLAQFKIGKPAVHAGAISTGDQFIGAKATADDIRSRLPGTLCIEMEGAAVGQVCYEHDVAFSIFRTISDTADEQAHLDFPSFLKEVAGPYARGVIREYLTYN